MNYFLYVSICFKKFPISLAMVSLTYLYLFFFFSSYLSYSSTVISLAASFSLWMITIYCYNSWILSSYSCFNPSMIIRFSSSTSLTFCLCWSINWLLSAFYYISWSLAYCSNCLCNFWFSLFNDRIVCFVLFL